MKVSIALTSDKATAIVFLDPILSISSITTLDGFGEFSYAGLGFVKAAGL
jgi:hypothetical protein